MSGLCKVHIPGDCSGNSPSCSSNLPAAASGQTPCENPVSLSDYSDIFIPMDEWERKYGPMADYADAVSATATRGAK